MTTRDSQRSKVYAAEREFRYGTGRELWSRFDAIDDIESYVRDAVTSRYVKSRYGDIQFVGSDTSRTVRQRSSALPHVGGGAWDRPTITVERRLSHAAACCRHFSWARHSLCFPNPAPGGPTEGPWVHTSWAYTEPTVLHELAHALVCIEAKSLRPAGHGREFARISLDLVGWKLGREAKALLKQAYRNHGVKFTKAGRKLTPEQRERARVILAEARAKAAANREQA